MSFQLLLRPAAKADLREAFAWYETQQAGLGGDFLEAVGRKLAQLESNPLQFPVVRQATRRAIVTRFPYSVFYVLQDQLISVLAMMHHAREPAHWQRRN